MGDGDQAAEAELLCSLEQIFPEPCEGKIPASCPHVPQHALKMRKSERKVLNAINSHRQDLVINSPFSPHWVDIRQTDIDTLVISATLVPFLMVVTPENELGPLPQLFKGTLPVAAGSATTSKRCVFTRKVRSTAKNQITGKKIPQIKPNPQTNTNPKHQKKGIFFAEGILSEVSE